MKLARAVASAGGIGYLKPAPGTWGSAAALAVGAALLAASPWLLAAGVAAALGAGLWAIPRAGGTDDPGWVVIDEVAGQWLAMCALPRPGWWLLAPFALFRLFDIAKPGPVGWFDRRPGAIGVMGDDLVAGAFAGLVVAALRWGVGAL